ncbi:hypothetical protein ALI144C_35865 [Actinosynnema sp. ALI-1.44]|uniref:hypothetical protein n=1 Tax=Actinosynnema sp. ALI-1.44 TaxID=1933779 RepID=UPI00097C966B|nr:hypothetical protein [Actinosynnema sp. ALI-1.44]ONI76078.1 hypothetical protein ALI144C_35865 [Actinosynnema sp. ALI-1.44]
MDLSLARDLDSRARALDDLTMTAADPEQVALTHVRRRGLLADLSVAAYPGGSADELERDGLVWLAGYVRAAEARAAYLVSDQRAAVGPTGDVDVSLDWFRLAAPVPPGVDPLTWLARWERILGAEPVGAGMAGFAMVREGGRWYRMEWRRDDGQRPALLRVEEGP